LDVWDLEDPTPDAVCCQQIYGRWVNMLICLKLVFSVCDSDCRVGCEEQKQGKQKEKIAWRP